MTIQNISRVLPVKSIRGVSIGLIFISLSVFWFVFNYEYIINGVAIKIATTLLILVAIFSLSIIGVNSITYKLSEIIFRFDSGDGSFVRDNKSNNLKEIQSILNAFSFVYEKIKEERDLILKISSNISHELKPPIVALKSIKEDLSEILFRNPLEKDFITSSIQDIDLILNDLDITSNKALLERKKILDLMPIGLSVEKAILFARKCYPNQEIQFVKTGQPSDLSMPGLNRELKAILKNAAEASISKLQPIKVLLNYSNELIVIKVIDRGIGIPPAQLQRIKNRITGTTKIDGNGIGLVSLYEWADQHKVNVEILSNNLASSAGTTLILEILI